MTEVRDLILVKWIKMNTAKEATFGEIDFNLFGDLYNARLLKRSCLPSSGNKNNFPDFNLLLAFQEDREDF